MIATKDLTRASSPGAGGRIPHPCDACKRSKLKCDQRRPTCDTCKKREKTCEYSAADGYQDGRVRKFHRRSRTGCSHCKARRVRCDEMKPVCGGCRRKGTPELCIFPPETERSSRSKSPTPPLHGTATRGTEASQRFAGCAPISANQDQVTTASTGPSEHFTGCAPVSAPQPNGGSTTTDAVPAEADFFSQPHSLLEQQTTGLSDPSASNAMSLWSPSALSAASPNTLLASLFGTQSNETFPQASIFDMPMDYLKPDQQPPTANVDTSVDGLPRNFFRINGYLDRPNQTGTVRDHEVDSGLGNLADWDPFSLENSGSTGSTPISLNSSTAYNSNLANFVSAEYRNRPEHPAYLYQLQMINDPDQLNPYFPSLEQRHQYRHFFQETSKSLLVTPTPQSANPFLCHFSHLALGAPAGQSLTHDAFRFALLSLASLDIGIKMSMAMPGMSQNAMYSTSDEQRSEAHKRLIAASISGILKEDPADAELAIATVIGLSIRDRLAGCQEWEPPLQVGRDIVINAGGPAAFINARPTADRRFLVEQMAVLELIGYLTIWVSPKLFAWDNDWFLYYDGDEGADHLQTVYGWTRQVIVYAARSMILCGEARDIEAMREAQPKPGYRRLKDIIEGRMTSLVKRVKDFLPEGEVVKATMLMNLYSPEILVGVLGIQACMDLCLRTVILMEDIKSSQVQSLVKSILDMSDESISRGRYAGLLLPLSWADGVAYDPILKQRAKSTLRSLKRHYHLNQELLERIINIDWATLNDIGLGDWEAFLRKHGYYVPCF